MCKGSSIEAPDVPSPPFLHNNKKKTLHLKKESFWLQMDKNKKAFLPYCHELSKIHEVDRYVNGEHPFALAAKANAMDTPNYWQAMNRPDSDLFVDVMQEEMDALDQLKTWELIDIDDVPSTAEGIGCIIIESTWAFKVKQYSDGKVKKRKAPLCV
eukprot:5308082-Ditylum_brightwellii.AAC.1